MRIALALLVSTFTFAAAAQQTHDVIVPMAGAARVLIPVAGSTPGGGGTFLRSDVHLINLRDVAQRVELHWMPQGGVGGTSVRTLDVPALSGIYSEDFVANIMNEDGLGGIQVVGVTQSGLFDPAARLHVASRIWTPRPDGADGTYSQSFPSVVLPLATESNIKAIFGLRHGVQHRLNIGISNPSQASQTFRVTVRVSTLTGQETVQSEIVLGAMSIEQRGVTLSAEGVVQVLVERIAGGSSEDWQAWASSVDNDSGDAWSNLGFPVE